MNTFDRCMNGLNRESAVDDAHRSFGDDGLDADFTDRAQVSEAASDFVDVDDTPLNFFVTLYDYYCRKHGVSEGCSELRRNMSSWCPLEVDAMQNFTLHGVYARIRMLDISSTYIGARQLMALADLIRVETVHVAGARFTSPAPALLASKLLYAGGQEHTEYVSFSFLPDLRVIYLSGLCLDNDLRASLPHSISGIVGNIKQSGRPMWPCRKVCGNDALRYFLDALQSHPSLREIELGRNQLGPALLPALSSLIKRTPSLVRVGVENTLLDADERSVIAALCAANRLRRDASGETVIKNRRRKWRQMQEEWLVQQTRSITQRLRADEGRDTAMNSGELKQRYHCETPYVCMEARPETNSLISSSRMPLASRSLSPPLTSLGLDTHTHPLSQRMGQLCEGSVANSAELTSGVSHIYLTPYLRYYKLGETRGVLSTACEKIVRAAFLSPRTATTSVLGGRPVPVGVPGKLQSCRKEGPLDSSTRELLRRDIEQSLLLQGLRRALLPEREPHEVLSGGCSLGDPHIRTTEEENYFVTLEQQKKQWDWVMGKLLDNMHYAYFSEGEAIYTVNERPYWLNFLPPVPEGEQHDDVALAKVEVRFGVVTDEESISARRTAVGDKQGYSVRPGEFFGDEDLLGATSIYALSSTESVSQKGSGGGSVANCGDSGGLLFDRQRLLHLYERFKLRQSTAVVRFEPSYTARDTVASAKRKHPRQVMIWQIPREVAFFYLFEPYQHFHRQALQRFSIIPATRLLPSTIACQLAYMMHRESFSPSSSDKRGTGSPMRGRAPGGTQARLYVDATAEDGRVVADTEALKGGLFILEHGEFVLRIFTAKGNLNERSLRPGCILASHNIMLLDEKERQHSGVSADCWNNATEEVLLGRDAALRQYRELQKRKKALRDQHLTPSTSTTIKGGTHLGERGEPVCGAQSVHPLSARDEYCLCLGRASHHWSLYRISYADFRYLPQWVRLSLTQACVVVGEPFKVAGT